MAQGLVHHGVEWAAQRFGDAEAIAAGDASVSFRELDQRSNAFARQLHARGVRAGSRVAIMTGNRPEFLVAVTAVSKLGAVVALFSPAWKAAEVDLALGVVEPQLAVADGDAVGLLAERLGDHAVLDLDDRATADAVLGEDPSPVPPAQVRSADDALLVFSSGTTGLPKAVRHTHESFAHAVRHWRLALDLGPTDRFQVATPPSHILGLLNLLTAVACGTSVRLHRRFDLDEFLARIASDRTTLEMAVAPIALAMANHPDLESYDLSSLRYVMWGATPVTPSVAETVTERTGVRWLPAYGTSEVPVIACNPVRTPEQWRLDSAGKPPADISLRVIDLDTGRPLEAGQVGEIQVLSPSVMAGYLPAAANSDAFAGTWYRTGDVGWVEPEGWVHLTDRSKEMIKVNGFQVAPAEIEAVLLGCAGVRDCAVFGVPDARTGEAPVAAVAVESGAHVAPEDLARTVAESLAGYKRLVEIRIVDQIPRLPSGKVLRRTLRESWSSSVTGTRK